MWRKGKTFALLVGMHASADIMKNSMEILPKFTDRTTLWPSNHTTRYLSKGYKNADVKSHMNPNVYKHYQQ